MEEEPTRGRARVDRIGEAFELNPALLQLPHQIDQLLDATAQAIELPHHKRIPRAQHVHGPCQTLAVGVATACPILEDALASSLGEGLALQLEVLILRRDASVADQHGTFPGSRVRRISRNPQRSNETSILFQERVSR